ncbi:hypothetical protein M885DRAFT_546260, partial [Pelagophyceae sp. CCMP2097]
MPAAKRSSWTSSRSRRKACRCAAAWPRSVACEKNAAVRSRAHGGARGHGGRMRRPKNGRRPRRPTPTTLHAVTTSHAQSRRPPWTHAVAGGVGEERDLAERDDGRDALGLRAPPSRGSHTSGRTHRDADMEVRVRRQRVVAPLRALARGALGQQRLPVVEDGERPRRLRRDRPTARQPTRVRFEVCRGGHCPAGFERGPRREREFALELQRRVALVRNLRARVPNVAARTLRRRAARAAHLAVFVGQRVKRVRLLRQPRRRQREAQHARRRRRRRRPPVDLAALFHGHVRRARRRLEAPYESLRALVSHRDVVFREALHGGLGRGRAARRQQLRQHVGARLVRLAQRPCRVRDRRLRPRRGGRLAERFCGGACRPAVARRHRRAQRCARLVEAVLTHEPLHGHGEGEVLLRAERGFPNGRSRMASVDAPRGVCVRRRVQRRRLAPRRALRLAPQQREHPPGYYSALSRVGCRGYGSGGAPSGGEPCCGTPFVSAHSSSCPCAQACRGCPDHDDDPAAWPHEAPGRGNVVQLGPQLEKNTAAVA